MLFNFADDTTTDSKGKDVKVVKAGLECNAISVLSFMASNGLIANQSKTKLFVLNNKSGTELTSNHPKQDAKTD